MCKWILSEVDDPALAPYWPWPRRNGPPKRPLGHNGRGDSGERGDSCAERGIFMMDTVIRNGVLVDGSGIPALFRGDLGIDRGRIVALGEVAQRGDSEGRRRRCGSSAPGFIDIHTHYDAQAVFGIRC